jgi:hypothetical protein
MEAMARRCAEMFVLQNGYTDLPATEDSTRWVLEVGEAGTWPRVFASREGTLEREAATAQCSMRQCLVLFRIRRTPLVCAYRAVTMTQVFTRLQLERGGIYDVRCDERRAEGPRGGGAVPIPVAQGEARELARTGKIPRFARDDSYWNHRPAAPGARGPA